MKEIERNLQKLSKHAHDRIQQRGIKPEVRDAIMKYADNKIRRGDGCICYSISKRLLDKLKRQGKLAAQLVEKANGVGLLLSSDGEMVSAMHIYDGAAGRPYRRAMRVKSRKKDHSPG